MIAIDIEIAGLRELDDWLEDVERRSKNLTPVSKRVLADLVDQNRGIKFDPRNPRSILRFTPPASWTIGSHATNYGNLINAGPGFMLDIIIEYIFDGRT